MAASASGASFLIADCGRFLPERPSLIRSLRGLAYLEVIVQGAATDLHSGTFGGTIDNPAQVLANMVSALKDHDRRIAVPGFYDDVVAPSPEAITALRAIPFDEPAYAKSLGVRNLAVGQLFYSGL